MAGVMKHWSPETWIGCAEAAPDSATPDHRMGEMLWSAITRGALLDPRWWPSWIRAVQTAADFLPGLISVDMEPDQGTPSQPRRWFADPLTRLLIAQWHRDRLRLPQGVTPSDCLRAFRPRQFDAGEDLARSSLDLGRAAWRLRLPGVLHAYATGAVPSVSVSKATWRRLTRHVITPEPERPVHVTAKPMRRNDMRAERGNLAAYKKTLPGTGRAGDRAKKMHARVALERLSSSPCCLHGTLRRWCIYALGTGGGRVSLGLAPSTVSGYLGQLLTIFAGWRDRDPCASSSHELVELFVSHLEQLAGTDTNKSINAMESFTRFYNSGRRDGDELELDLDAYRTDRPVSANLISPAEYDHVATRLARSDPAAALVLMLAFRTGARLPEIMGLKVGDFIEARGRLELVIQENEARALKTKTSRRILPLDVLLDASERATLSSWLVARRPVARLMGDAFLFGEPGAVAPPREKQARDTIEAALRKACRSDDIKFAHLRHSFASYLFATLLLPQDVARPIVPEALVDVISPARFAPIVDRLLGKGRLGGGAVHAVSQIMGHTGPATTLRSYCHLLDLCLGLYVSRPSSLAPIQADWLTRRLGVTPDARRKAESRIEPPVGSASTRPGRPTRATLLRHAPELVSKMVDANLIDAGADRASRHVRRAQSGKIEVVGSVPFVWPTKEIERAPRVRNRVRPSERYIVPWSVMVSVLEGAGDDLIEAARVERWRSAAARFSAHLILGSAERAAAPFCGSCPDQRPIALLTDAWLSMPRRLLQPERKALVAGVGTLRGDGSRIRLKRLADARAFVGLLAMMGFNDDEIRLTTTSRSGVHLSSERLHSFLRGSDVRHPLSTRQGWTGSLIVRVRPRGIPGPRLGWQAARFALVMLAVDAGATDPVG